MPRINHTHKYCKRVTGTKPVWACALPDCAHFMPPHLTSLVEGKSSYCWECDSKFILDLDALGEDKPRCLSCRHPETAGIEEYLSEAMKQRLG